MTIKPADLADECVHQGTRFGIHPHYLVAVADIRSGISDTNDGDRIGPFRLTQAEWNANCFDQEFDITDFEAGDIDTWEMQCCIYALMAWRAQNQCIARMGQLPSAADLYREQWPDDTKPLPEALQASLDKTKALMDPAFVSALGGLPGSSTTIDAGNLSTSPDPDVSKPVPAKGTETFIAKAPGIMAKLIADFDLKDFQAAGLMGNLGEECDGFREMQEKKPLIAGSKGGFGWAQWTGPRRTQFELFCSTKGLSPFSDAANYGFLKLELTTTQKMSLVAVQKAVSISKAVRAFEATFERAAAGLEHFDRRDDWSNLALQSFRAGTEQIPPAAVVKILDPDLLYRVVSKANLGTSTYWVIDQFTDNGGQVLVKQDGDQTPVVLASDTTIFPLKSGLVPADIAAQLSAGFDPAAPNPSPVQVPAPVVGADVSARIFAMAKECDETLVTRDAPNTNHGRLACAFAVNEVVRRAIGKPVGGGNSTADMGEVLSETQTQVSEANIGSGMIIISPTHGSNVGHVGIVGEIKAPVSATVIYSNSSSRGVFSHSFTLGTWKAFYRDRKGLPVFFYALKS